MLAGMKSAVRRRVEEKVMMALVYGEDTDMSITSIEMGDFEAKNFYRFFSLGDQLGQGMSTKVFKGITKKKEKGDEPMVCAIKRVRKFRLKGSTKEALFREVQILRELNHPNVVNIYQFYPKDRAYYYVVLEYLPGGVLIDRIVKKDTYTERDVRDVMKVLVDAVDYLHAYSIVHRDLKPSNILVSSMEGDGISGLKIADFSTAMSVKDGPITTNGGDPVNAAPEMLLARPYLTGPDMWSIGLITYILLAAKHPFFYPDTTTTFCRVVAGDYLFEPDDWRNISIDAKDFISKLLVVDQDKRMTAKQSKNHPWLLASGQSLEAHDLSENLQEFEVFNAKTKLRAVMKTVLAARRMFSGLPTDEFSKAYELGDMLGEGGFGQVFKATPRTPESFSGEDVGAEDLTAAPRVYAVKRIGREGLSEEGELEVIAEASIMRELNHPKVVSIYDFYQDDPKHFYMVLELMSGGELFDRIVRKGHYNEADARDACVALLEALEYIHDQGVVHRDLKPQNLLLADANDDSSIRIADFGLAASVRDGYASAQCGTAPYMAPELWVGVPYGTSVDMWSAGVIIFIILSGSYPFPPSDLTILGIMIVSGRFRFDPDDWSDISSEAKDLIRKLLTVEPTMRLTAAEACKHPWLSMARGTLTQHKLSLDKLRIFNAKRKLRAAIRSVLATRMIMRKAGRIMRIKRVNTPTPLLLSTQATSPS